MIVLVGTCIIGLLFFIIHFAIYVYSNKARLTLSDTHKRTRTAHTFHLCACMRSSVICIVLDLHYPGSKVGIHFIEPCACVRACVCDPLYISICNPFCKSLLFSLSPSLSLFASSFCAKFHGTLWPIVICVCVLAFEVFHFIMLVLLRFDLFARIFGNFQK